jgi:hypothetical protein
VAENVEIEDVTVLHETEMAILVESPNLDTVENKAWVPKSVISDDSEVYKAGTEGQLIVSEWWAEKAGWL